MKKLVATITGAILAAFSTAILCAGSSEAELVLGGDPLKGRKIYPLCASCHLDSGWGKPDGSFPVIAAQHPAVLLKQLEDIRTRKRQNPTMFPFADPAEIGGEQAMRDVVAYIANLPPNPLPGQGPGDALEAGAKLFAARCVQCHGEQGEGNNEARFPRLKGQHYAYLVRQLLWIRDGYRNNANPAMVVELSNLSDEDINAVADYISRL